MIVIPGLSRPLEAVGKHVVSWDDSHSRLSVDVGGLVSLGCLSKVHLWQLAYAWPLSALAR